MCDDLPDVIAEQASAQATYCPTRRTFRSSRFGRVVRYLAQCGPGPDMSDPKVCLLFYFSCYDIE
jgi:hypothetical protein